MSFKNFVLKNYPQYQKEIEWNYLAIPDLLVNPLSFELEYQLFEAYDGSSIEQVFVEERESKLIKKWFHLDELNHRPLFWQRGFIEGPPAFYNYPYTMGLLLSNMIEKQFVDELIKDTAKLNLRELIHKYWKKESRVADFWKECFEKSVVFTTI